MVKGYLRMPKFKDLTNQKFSRLTAISYERFRSKSGVSVIKWHCVCDCGGTALVITDNLTSGRSASCGCLHRERASLARKTLGLSGTRVYNIWSHMKRRCNNKHNNAYERYGGRGITYDHKWETFEGFWEDMEEGYEEHLTLDRKDNNKGYCKDNCRWVGYDKQNQNQRMYKNNTSGKAGVQLHKRKGVPVYYSACWNDMEQRRCSKYFSIKEHGEQEAFRLACEYRDEQIRLLNEQGAGYSESHGK